MFLSTIITLILADVLTPKLDPLSLVDESVHDETQAIMECSHEPVRRVVRETERFVLEADGSAVATAEKIVDFLDLPPCDTDVTQLDHEMDHNLEVFHVVSGSCWVMRQYLVVEDKDGAIHKLQPSSPSFAKEYRQLFWDPTATGEESLRGYASFFIKLLFVTSGHAFLPSEDIAEYVASQPLSPYRSRPVDSLRKLDWPLPEMRYLGREVDAYTYIWHWGTGEVTRCHLKIGPDGSLEWSEEMIGQQEYE